MPKIIKIIAFILLIYFISCLFIYININHNQGYYSTFVHYIKIIYISYIFSLLTFLIFTWKHKRSIIYFLLLVVIIIFNYCVIVINQTDNIIPNYRFFDPLFLVHNYGNSGWNFVILLKYDNAIIPYYLLFLTSISIIIDYLIIKVKLFKKDKPFIIKIFNIISILLLIYFIGCYYIIVFNTVFSRGCYKYILVMYLFYIASLIIFLLFNNKKNLSVLYFLFIISIIIYNYIIILTNHGVDTAPFMGYSSKLLIYNGYYADRYNWLLRNYKFQVIFPYIILLLGNIYVVGYYVICRLKVKK